MSKEKDFDKWLGSYYLTNMDNNNIDLDREEDEREDFEDNDDFLESQERDEIGDDWDDNHFDDFPEFENDGFFESDSE